MGITVVQLQTAAVCVFCFHAVKLKCKEPYRDLGQRLKSKRQTFQKLLQRMVKKQRHTVNFTKASHTCNCARYLKLFAWLQVTTMEGFWQVQVTSPSQDLIQLARCESRIYCNRPGPNHDYHEHLEYFDSQKSGDFRTTLTSNRHFSISLDIGLRTRHIWNFFFRVT